MAGGAARPRGDGVLADRMKASGGCGDRMARSLSAASQPCYRLIQQVRVEACCAVPAAEIARPQAPVLGLTTPTAIVQTSEVGQNFGIIC